ncbi:DUF2490 domain-containing protein [Echinicola sp. CAU 1574]|uniref:DUF2490 domain-containing protein n=1 Tax=Echinicola arenosa TaxID=2774144 RepID=A0ABR9AF46_9BACT|nr:DUF2490 domain-containing protein [Echinicola arenosa]MBD8487331.1 DUF2490 domain-containing protein [Echinicola arenosa]
MKRILLLSLFALVAYESCFGQISPPGLGEVNSSEWFAIGAKQRLNQDKSWTSMTYLGVGRTSTPDDFNPLKRSGIYVINEEVTHHFKKHWKYALALSYRWQDMYQSAEPFEPDEPRARQEIRSYGRFSYLTTIKKMVFELTYRPEMRLFYNPDFSKYDKQAQFRSRFRSKISIPIDANQRKKLSLSTEVLFSTTKQESWDNIRYKESRFCFFYSVTVPERKITFDIGYMNNLLGKPIYKYSHYLAFDVVFNDPFGR